MVWLPSHLYLYAGNVSIYNYNPRKVSVCLFIYLCMYVFVLYSRALGWTDRDKPYIFRILRVPRASSRNFFPIIPVLKGIMGRFVRVGGSPCISSHSQGGITPVSKKLHVDGQTRQRRVFPLVYYYNGEKVSVCLFVCPL